MKASPWSLMILQSDSHSDLCISSWNSKLKRIKVDDIFVDMALLCTFFSRQQFFSLIFKIARTQTWKLPRPNLSSLPAFPCTVISHLSHNVEDLLNLYICLGSFLGRRDVLSDLYCHETCFCSSDYFYRYLKHI